MIELTQENFIANAIQSIKDLINGGLTHRNMKTFRTFFVVNAMDSLDSDVPMYVPFAIPASTAEVVEVRVNFWLLPFRAYSKSATGGGGTTISQQTTTTTPEGGGKTSGSSSTSTTGTANSYITRYVVSGFTGVTNVGDEHASGLLPTGLSGYNLVLNSHYHGMDHTHYCPNHQHSISHTHETPSHSHGITFGIYEEDNSPSVTLYVSRDGGATYPTRVGTYSTDQIGIEITSYVDTPGSKMLKFESTDLGRLSVQIEIKVDMSR